MIIMVNWEDIHPDFTEELQKDWEDFGFGYEETKKWIVEKKLVPKDAIFAYHLQNVKKDKENYNNPETLEGAQKYLDRSFPLEERDKVVRLNLIDKKLKGSLIVDNWTNLREIKILNNEITSLSLVGLPKLVRVYFIKELKDYHGNNNFSSVDLSIANCPEIEQLDLRRNCITSLNFLNNLNVEKLSFLNLGDNSFPAQNLSFFDKLKSFSNLERLYLSHNPFYGSLKPLRNMHKLQFLDISNTSISSGLEYLPESVEEIILLKEGQSKLRNILKDSHKISREDIDIWAYYHFPTWKEANKEKIQLLLATDQLVTIRNNIQRFFAKWETYLLKQEKLSQLQNKIKVRNYFGLIGSSLEVLGGVTSLAAINYSTPEIAYPAASFAFAGLCLDKVSGKLKENLQTKEFELRTQLDNWEIKFSQEAKKIKMGSIVELSKLHQDLSLLSKEPTKFPIIDRNFNVFLEAVNNLPKEESNDQRRYMADILEQDEQEKMENEKIKQFIQIFQIDWGKINEAITKLQKEIENYRQKMYQENENSQQPQIIHNPPKLNQN